MYGKVFALLSVAAFASAATLVQPSVVYNSSPVVAVSSNGAVKLARPPAVVSKTVSSYTSPVSANLNLASSLNNLNNFNNLNNLNNNLNNLNNLNNFNNLNNLNGVLRSNGLSGNYVVDYEIIKSANNGNLVALSRNPAVVASNGLGYSLNGASSSDPFSAILLNSAGAPVATVYTSGNPNSPVFIKPVNGVAQEQVTTITQEEFLELFKK